MRVAGAASEPAGTRVPCSVVLDSLPQDDRLAGQSPPTVQAEARRRPGRSARRDGRAAPLPTPWSRETLRWSSLPEEATRLTRIAASLPYPPAPVSPRVGSLYGATSGRRVGTGRICPSPPPGARPPISADSLPASQATPPRLSAASWRQVTPSRRRHGPDAPGSRFADDVPASRADVPQAPLGRSHAVIAALLAGVARPGAGSGIGQTVPALKRAQAVTSRGIEHLQRHVGNQAVTRLLSAHPAAVSPIALPLVDDTRRDTVIAAPHRSIAIRSVVQRQPENSSFTTLTGGGKDSPVQVEEEEEVEAAVKAAITARYLAGVRKRVESHAPLAFIVNAILPFRDIHKIPNVVKAIVTGLGEDYDGRVVIVLGVNANVADASRLDTALSTCGEIIEELRWPIAIVPSLWAGKKFPYGTMRNEVLHSDYTRRATNALILRGFYPYISIQDFDTAPRTVGGPDDPTHIFDYLEDTTSFEAEDEEEGRRPAEQPAVETGMAENEPPRPDKGKERVDRPDQSAHRLPPLRPLLMLGGYRVGPTDALVEATRIRFKANDEVVPKELTDADKCQESVTAFADHISTDMKKRQDLAQLHPLLPYPPEPNLFLDAVLPLENKSVRFSEGAAEATQLAKAVNEQYAMELAVLAELLQVESTPSGGEPTEEEGSAPSAVPLSIMTERRRQQTRGDAQNLRHSIRGTAYIADFIHGAVATDLSRLFYEFISAKRVPQTHDLGTVLDRFYANKPAKKGVRIRDYSNDLIASEDPPWPLAVESEGSKPADAYFHDIPTKRRKLLGGSKNKLSPAISTLVPHGLAKGEKVGLGEFEFVDPHLLAIRQPPQLGKLQLPALLAMAKTRLERIGGGTPLDGNCLYHAVNSCLGEAQNEEQAKALRDRVVAWALDDQNLPIVVEWAYDHGVDIDELVLCIGRNGNWQGNAGDLAPRVVASAVGIAIDIVQRGGQRTTIRPLIGAAVQSIEVYLDRAHYSVEPTFELPRVEATVGASIGAPGEPGPSEPESRDEGAT